MPDTESLASQEYLASMAPPTLDIQHITDTSSSIKIPTPEYLLRIHGDQNKPLVSIKPDGTVVIHEHGAEREAAEIFWRCVEEVFRSQH